LGEILKDYNLTPVLVEEKEKGKWNSLKKQIKEICTDEMSGWMS
jgi:hypothetical protein